MSCAIINFDSVTPSARLLCTVRLLILAVIPDIVRLKGPLRLFSTREYIKKVFLKLLQNSQENN